MATQEQTLYELIGVPEDADTNTIRKAARERLRRTHPDLGGDPELAAAINAAAAVLTDTDRRAAYDAKLQDPDLSVAEAAPDPSEFTDSWGEETAWDDPEIVDGEIVDEEPRPAPHPQEPSAPAPTPTTEPTPTVEAPYERPRRTPVHTVARAAMLHALLPAVATAAVLLLIVTVTGASQLALAVGLGAGVLIGIGAALWPTRRRATTPRRRTWVGTRTATVVAAVTAVLACGLTAVTGGYPTAGPALQGLIATMPGLWLTTTGVLRHHALRRRAIAPGLLKETGRIRGASAGTTAAEITAEITWPLLEQPGLAAARAFRSPESASPYNEAISCGNRIALIRTVVLPNEMPPGTTIYWSAPSLFLRGADGVPRPILTLPFTEAFRRAVASRATTPLRVQEFIVLAQPAGAGVPHSGTEHPGDVRVVPAREAVGAIAGWLRGEDSRRAATAVDHDVACAAVAAVYSPPKV